MQPPQPLSAVNHAGFKGLVPFSWSKIALERVKDARAFYGSKGGVLQCSSHRVSHPRILTWKLNVETGTVRPHTRVLGQWSSRRTTQKIYSLSRLPWYKIVVK